MECSILINKVVIVLFLDISRLLYFFFVDIDNGPSEENMGGKSSS